MPQRRRYPHERVRRWRVALPRRNGRNTEVSILAHKSFCIVKFLRSHWTSLYVTQEHKLRATLSRKLHFHRHRRHRINLTRNPRKTLLTSRVASEYKPCFWSEFDSISSEIYEQPDYETKSFGFLRFSVRKFWNCFVLFLGEPCRPRTPK